MSEILIVTIFILKDFYLRGKELPKAINFFLKWLLILGFYEFGFVQIISLIGRVGIDFPDEFWMFFSWIDYLCIGFALVADICIARFALKDANTGVSNGYVANDDSELVRIEEKAKPILKKIGSKTIFFILLLAALGVYYRNISSLALIGLGFIPAKIAQDKGRDFMTSYVHWILLVIIAFVVRII